GRMRDKRARRCSRHRPPWTRRTPTSKHDARNDPRLRQRCGGLSTGSPPSSRPSTAKPEQRSAVGGRRYGATGGVVGGDRGRYPLLWGLSCKEAICDVAIVPRMAAVVFSFFHHLANTLPRDLRRECDRLPFP